MSNETRLSRFGFKNGRSGVHTSRTMMLSEISELFSYHSLNASGEVYQEQIEQFNVLNKPTQKARQLTWRHLVDLYGMNSEIPLFRIFRLLWDADEEAKPVLACQMALSRDPLLRLSKDLILKLSIGELFTRQQMEAFFSDRFPDRFSSAMLRSLAQNLNGTWTYAGYLEGRNKKYRSEPIIRSANVVFALVQGYFHGITGPRLFNSEWTQILDCRTERLIELARMASHTGLITFKHSSEAIEVSFPDLLTRDEELMLHE